MKTRKKAIKELKKEGKRICDISRILKIPYASVRYYYSDKERKKKIEYAKKYQKENPKKRGKEYREYQRKYHRERYNRDKKYKEKIKKRAREYSKSKYWKEKQ